MVFVISNISPKRIFRCSFQYLYIDRVSFLLNCRFLFVFTEEDEIDVVSVTGDGTEQKPATTRLSPDATSQEERTMNTPPRQRWSKRKNIESSEQENEDGNGRISHNDLERKRRNDLRNRFQSLRKSIPTLEESERAAKITILRRASELIPSLLKEEERLLALKEEEKKRNAALLNTLMKLTKNNKRR